MSQISQMSAPARRMTAQRLAITGVATCLIVGLSLAPFADGIIMLAGRAHLHAPDIGVFQRLPLAIKMHLLAAVGAVILGAALMWVRKGRTFHRVAGWTWVSLVSLVAGSSIFITQLNHGHWSLLHLFTGWTLLMLPLAVFAAKRRNVERHRRTMMGLFYGGFVINGFIAMIPGRTVWQLFFG
ncbi:MAG: hypothetical protein CFE28_00535 [Alphaproteobacteria bacterium PA2]|nr:MAG: hypothetical protein CFE28_00535 [Alphaproteobacteria bacterium PA2]